MDLVPLLVEADDLLSSDVAVLPILAAAEGPRPDGRLASSRGFRARDEGPAAFSYSSGDPNVLAERRWAVIAPQGPEGDRLLSIISPLHRARTEEQRYPAPIYRVPSDLDAESARRWVHHVYWNTAEEERPGYLLILGDFDGVSYELQQALSAEACVGRLAFRQDQDYEAYVHKLLRRQANEDRSSKKRALFYATQDGSTATTLARSTLLLPCFERLKTRLPEAELITNEDSSPSELLSSRPSSDPTVLLSVGRCAGAPRRGWSSYDQQRALQGALCTRNGMITGEDLRGQSFLPDGVWLLLGSFGAGTLTTSGYYAWLHQFFHSSEKHDIAWVLSNLPRPGDRPFVAALPQAALANPQGPLAVAASVDLSWCYQLAETGTRNEERWMSFAAFMQTILRGARVGVAHQDLMRSLSSSTTELSYLIERERLDPGSPREGEVTQRAALWLLRQELSSWVLLGDPAVQL